jgi:hypothetical protein
MKAILLAIALVILLPLAVRAEMPPKHMDLGDASMSETELLDVYREAFPTEFAKLTLKPVLFGQANKACAAMEEDGASMATYGCVNGDVVVYSRDRRWLALVQRRDYDPHMANNVIRHELAHRLFKWPRHHPNARP